MKITYTPRAQPHILQECIAVYGPTAAFRTVRLIQKHTTGFVAQPRSGRLGRIGSTHELVINGTPTLPLIG